MNVFSLTGIEQIIFGVYLIAHGLIYLMFLFYFTDEKENYHTGWSGKSLLSQKLPKNINIILGKAFWVVIAILFAISGVGVLEIINIDSLVTPILILACLIGIVAHVIYWVGLSPSPYHWILGLVIDLSILTFILFLTDNISLLVYFLMAIWFYGMVLHSKILSLFVSKESYT